MPKNGVGSASKTDQDAKRIDPEITIEDVKYCLKRQQRVQINKAYQGCNSYAADYQLEYTYTNRRSPFYPKCGEDGHRYCFFVAVDIFSKK